MKSVLIATVAITGVLALGVACGANADEAAEESPTASVTEPTVGPTRAAAVTAFGVTVEFNEYRLPGEETMEDTEKYNEAHREDREEIDTYLMEYAEQVEFLPTTRIFPDWHNWYGARVHTDVVQFCDGFLSEFGAKDYVKSLSCAESEDGSPEQP